MGEININIEGYNVNGICVGCLNYNRKMFYKDEVKWCFKLIANIEVPDGLSIQVCWECLARIQSIIKFTQQIKKSFDILIAYSEKQSFLNSPTDLSSHAVSRLSAKTFEIFSELPPKFEPPVVLGEEVKCEVDKIEDIEKEIAENEIQEVENLPEIEVKEEFEDTQSDIFQYNLDDLSQDAQQSSEDDLVLSQLKTEDGKKRKRGRKKKDDSKKVKRKKDKAKNSRKMKNLPESLVKLYKMEETEMQYVRQMDAANEAFLRLRHKCVHCLIGFNTSKQMEVHMNGKHAPKSENDYQCDICKAYFITKDNIKIHKKLHLIAYRCRKCNMLTTVKKIMLAHDCAKYAIEAVNVCPDCPDKAFSTKAKLLYHRSVAHQEKPQCDCCGKVFANKMTLKYHLKILPQNKDDKPKEKLSIPCKGCDKVFHSKKSYRAHVVIHDGLTYPCPVCGKLFQWKRNLARHMRNHREKEEGATHQCRECGKSFSSRDCYNNHMRLSKRHVHESTYVHSCHFCGKKFASRWCMNDHMDWEHLKIIKYQCSVCYKPFKTAKIMVAHMNNIHEGRNKREPDGEHLCEICGKSYKTVKRLKGHVWAMHTNRSEAKSFKCPLCPATFSWQTSIYKHIKMMHYTKRLKPRVAAKKPEPYPGIELANRMQYFQQNIASNLAQSVPTQLDIVHT
ncbi:RB-associated KRAB zinc finger protein isoform X2 [Bicyclus anynana]|uniref:RB-associated KRAB zinc finger protein isoform X2 n=1 Tax=Bicyclus anynana TaxID=110368 RepID=A0ABM3M4K1_BICAN|nr:RB-associated KRAB zinc finger protein isoform X2 [Bicyclus anynana]